MDVGCWMFDVGCWLFDVLENHGLGLLTSAATEGRAEQCSALPRRDPQCSLISWRGRRGTMLSTRPTLSPGAALIAAEATLATWASAFMASAWTAKAAGPTLSARTALTTGRAHLFQLFHLVGRQDLRQFSFRVRFERGQLLLLIRGQIESHLCPRRQQMKPALNGAARAAAHFVRTRTGGWRLRTLRRRSVVLGREEAG